MNVHNNIQIKNVSKKYVYLHAGFSLKTKNKMKDMRYKWYRLYKVHMEMMR